MKHFCGLFAAWLVLLIATACPTDRRGGEGFGDVGRDVSLVPTWFDPPRPPGSMSELTPTRREARCGIGMTDPESGTDRTSSGR